MILLNKAKNYIMNGAFDFFQRGAAINPLPNGSFPCDRFKYNQSGTMVVRSTSSAPPVGQDPNFNHTNGLALIVTTAQGVLLNTSYAYLQQAIEGQFFAPLKDKKLVLSFWARGTAGGVYSVSFRNTATDRSYVATFTVTSSTWEKHSIAFTHDSTGSWNYSNGIGLIVGFHIASGSNFHAPALNTWLSGNYFGHSSCVNGVAGLDSFSIFGVQLEEGEEASNFERMGGHVDNEFQMCQRYFEKTYNLDVPPATITNVGALVAAASWATPVGIGHLFKFATQKRATPTVVQYNPVTGASGSFRDVVASDNKGSIFEFESPSSIYVQTNAGYTGNVKLLAHYTVDAEL